jgi:hypothetical protein
MGHFNFHSLLFVAPITAVNVTILMRVVVFCIVCCVLLISAVTIVFLVSYANLIAFINLLSLAVLAFIAPKFCLFILVPIFPDSRRFFVDPTESLSYWSSTLPYFHPE